MIRLALVLAVLASATPALADAKADAQKHVDQATELFGQGKFAEAIEHLKDAYTLDPRPELLYALGQAHAGLGQCDKAKIYYDRFVEARPKEAATARDATAACKDAPPPEPVKPPPKPAPPPPPPPPPPPAPWYTDTLGVVIASVGLVATGAGGYLLYSSTGARADAENAGTFDDYFAEIDKAERKRRNGMIVGIAGIAVLGGGLLKIALTDRRRETVQVTPAPGGGAVTFTTRF